MRCPYCELHPSKLSVYVQTDRDNKMWHFTYWWTITTSDSYREFQTGKTQVMTCPYTEYTLLHMRSRSTKKQCVPVCDTYFFCCSMTLKHKPYLVLIRICTGEWKLLQPSRMSKLKLEDIWCGISSKRGSQCGTGWAAVVPCPYSRAIIWNTAATALISPLCLHDSPWPCWVKWGDSWSWNVNSYWKRKEAVWA